MWLSAHATRCSAVLFCVQMALGCAPGRSARGPSGSGGEGASNSRALGDSEARRGESQTSSGEPVGPHPLLDDREPQRDAALPRLTYKHLGMHIGGESNSPESKRPWFEDIERNEDAILSCFRFVRDPEQGGSYGVDLYVGKSGGAPEVRGSRQKMGDAEFDECMKQAFGAIEFHEPERPTVLSYSIFFELDDGESN